MPKKKRKKYEPKIDTIVKIWNFDQIRHAKRVHKIGLNRHNSCLVL